MNCGIIRIITFIPIFYFADGKYLRNFQIKNPLFFISDLNHLLGKYNETKTWKRNQIILSIQQMCFSLDLLFY